MLEILPNIYRIEIPLPRNPLKFLNSYVIIGEDRNLIIDTGFNREECKNAMFSGLAQLGVNLEKTDFFITHMHADHSGLLSELAKETSKIYCSKTDGEIINGGKSSPHWEKIRDFTRLSGFPVDELNSAIEKHPGYKYGNIKKHNFCYIKEGDCLEIAGYKFKCIETPGHTSGIVCLYEPNKKLFFSADHILGDITPNITMMQIDHNPLKDYFSSLDKVSLLDIELVLPGHRSFIKDCKKRIAELKEHHRNRLDEVLQILSKGDMTAAEVASKMTWDMTYDSWEQFPTPQKWFAIGEANAHIKYLEEEGFIKKKSMDEKIIIYTLNK